jgi:CxxC-x17-CxxC domain-containing protein
MADFKKFGGNKGKFGGGDRDRGPRRDFGGKPSICGGRPPIRGGGGKPGFGGPRREGGPELFDATCATCGKATQVPFRPTGQRPVYCRDCFRKNEAGHGDYEPQGLPRQKKSFDDFPKRDFSAPRPQQSSAPVQDRRIDELKSQMAGLSSKVDRILEILQDVEIVETPEPAPVSMAEMEEAKVPARKSEKKAPAKTKKAKGKK